jgi:hypothetical protein
MTSLWIQSSARNPCFPRRIGIDRISGNRSCQWWIGNDGKPPDPSQVFPSSLCSLLDSLDHIFRDFLAFVGKPEHRQYAGLLHRRWVIVSQASVRVPLICLPARIGNIVDRACSSLSGDIATDLLYSHASAAAINKKVGPMTTSSSARTVNNTLIPLTVENEATRGQ